MRPRHALIPAILAACSVPLSAQRLDYADVLQPTTARPAPRLAYADVSVAAAAQPAPPVAGENVRAFYGDRFEWLPLHGADAYSWDVSAEIGGSANRLWLSSTGDGVFGGPLEYLEFQALYSRPVSEAGLSLQVGLRQDFLPRPRRSYAVFGFQGNISGPLYVGAFGFLSHRGELSGRAFAYYDLPLAGPLILQPAAEAELYAQDVPELGIGAGLTYVEAGLRLRYRLGEPFSPYVGINWERLAGKTARFAREAGDEIDSANLVLGFRSYF